VVAVSFKSILEIARLQSGTVRFRSERLSLVELVEARLPRHRKAAEARRVTIALDDSDSDEHGLTVWADRRRVNQILDHLLDNALKFTREGSEVRVSLSSEGERVTCAIQDQGIGIALEHQRLIFEPFQQVSEKIHLDYGGLGIGLALVRALVEQQGGRVRVKSLLNAGATFTFSLPANASHLARDTPTHE